jgi:hypothetical protein
MKKPLEWMSSVYSNSEHALFGFIWKVDIGCGRDNGRSNNHPNKSQGDQKVMHGTSPCQCSCNPGTRESLMGLEKS